MKLEGVEIGPNILDSSDWRVDGRRRRGQGAVVGGGGRPTARGEGLGIN